MEESDGIVLDSLRQFVELPKRIKQFKDIGSEEMFDLAIRALEYLKVDTQEIRNLAAKAQRFRFMARLNQGLQQHLQTQFELGQLMSPSVTFLRNFCVLLISKLGAAESASKSRSPNKAALEERNKSSTGSRGGKIFKKWLAEEWICPALLGLPEGRLNVSAYRFPLSINKPLLRDGVDLSVLGERLGRASAGVLGNAMIRHRMKVREFEEREGLAKKHAEEDEEIVWAAVVSSNEKDWVRAAAGDTRKRAGDEQEQQMVKEGPAAHDHAAVPTMVNSMGKEDDQVSLMTEESISEELNPIEKLKRQALAKSKAFQSEIASVLGELKQVKEKMEVQKGESIELLSQNEARQERINTQRAEGAELRKQLERKQLVLNSLGGGQDLQGDVRKLESEVGEIEKQAREEIRRLEDEIVSMQRTAGEKMEVLRTVKGKLNRVEDDYEAVCGEIREKEEMKGEIRIGKGTVSRLYYNKKITEIEGRWRDTQREAKKIRAGLEELREKTRLTLAQNVRLDAEIENMLNQGKARLEQETVGLRTVIGRCREVFEKTQKTLEEIREVKMEMHGCEIEVQGLAGKNYQASIEKIGKGLEELRKETADMANRG